MSKGPAVGWRVLTCLLVAGACLAVAASAGAAELPAAASTARILNLLAAGSGTCRLDAAAPSTMAVLGAPRPVCANPENCTFQACINQPLGTVCGYYTNGDPKTCNDVGGGCCGCS